MLGIDKLWLFSVMIGWLDDIEFMFAAGVRFGMGALIMLDILTGIMFAMVCCVMFDMECCVMFGMFVMFSMLDGIVSDMLPDVIMFCGTPGETK